MGNLAKSFDSRFVIRRERQAACLGAIYAGQSSAMYSPSIDPDRSVEEQLAEVFEDEGWKLSTDEKGNVSKAEFVGEKLGGFQEFDAAAPFVEPGSFIDIWQEYGEGPGGGFVPNSRWVFNGKSSVIESLDPTREPKYARALSVHAANDERQQRGLPPLCTRCAIHGWEPREMKEVPARRLGPFRYFQCSEGHPLSFDIRQMPG